MRRDEADQPVGDFRVRIDAKPTMAKAGFADPERPAGILDGGALGFDLGSDQHPRLRRPHENSRARTESGRRTAGRRRTASWSDGFPLQNPSSAPSTTVPSGRTWSANSMRLLNSCRASGRARAPSVAPRCLQIRDDPTVREPRLLYGNLLELGYEEVPLFLPPFSSGTSLRRRWGACVCNGLSSLATLE